MNRVLVHKCFHEGKWLLLACSAALFVFNWVRVWLVSRLETPAFATIIEQVWDKYEKFSPVPFSQLLTYSGRIAVGFDDPVVVFCVIVWSIGRGSDCVSGELGRGSMEMLLAQPISRRQVLASQALVTTFGLIVLVLATWAGIAAGVQTTSVKQEVQPTWKIPGLPFRIPQPLAEPVEVVTPISDYVEPAVFGSAVVNLFAFGFCFAGVTALISACDRFRWRTIGVCTSIFVVQMVLKVVGKAAEEVSWLCYLTVFTAYEPQWAVSVQMNQPEAAWSVVRRAADGGWLWGPMASNLLLLAVGAVSYLAAGIVFARRDLPAPL